MYSINVCEKQYGNQKDENGYDNYNNTAYMKISHLWQCGEWTHAEKLLDIRHYLRSININATNYNAIRDAKVITKDVIHAESFLIHNHTPQLSIIQPRSLNHSLLLSKLCLTR